MRKKLAALLLTGAIALAPMQPAYALFGVGDVVIDPTNLAQNILTAARTLEMINNQITQLQNEAQMLINQGRNLAKLPNSSAKTPTLHCASSCKKVRPPTPNFIYQKERLTRRPFLSFLGVPF